MTDLQFIKLVKTELMQDHYSAQPSFINLLEIAEIFGNQITKEIMEKTKEKAKQIGMIVIALDNSKLMVLNNSMRAIDTLNIMTTDRQYKTVISICIELRTELLQKAIKTRQKDKSFTIKLPYYKADALYNYLKEFEIYFPDDFGAYESNAILQIKNDLHQQLQ